MRRAALAAALAFQVYLAWRGFAYHRASSFAIGVAGAIVASYRLGESR